MRQTPFLIPFATSGDQTVIPVPTQSDGSVSYTQGFSFDYERDQSTDPLAKDVPRQGMNYLFFVLSQAIAAWQTGFAPEWITSAQNGGTPYLYGKGSTVLYSASGNPPFTKYVSLIDANGDTPGATGNWQVVPDAIASNAQALAGTDNTTLMTPLRTQAVAATLAMLGGSASQAFLVANATAANQAASLGQVQNAGSSFAVATGTANAHTIALTPALTARTEGMLLRYKAPAANTGAVTLADGVGTVAVVGANHAALQGGEYAPNGDALVMWNSSIGGGSYVLLECTGGALQIAPGTQSQHAAQIAQVQQIPRHQTVLSGIADANGYAAFFSAGSGLACNLNAATPLVLAFAAGYGPTGVIAYVGTISASVTGAWSALPASVTNYLYVDRNTATGALTYGASSLTPIYQDVAPASPATDQHWFSPLTMTMQRWSGSAWVVVQRVFVGRAVCGASSVASVSVYAFLGRYVSQPAALTTASAATATATHNIGLFPRHGEWYLVNSTQELGYSVGTRVPLAQADNVTVCATPAFGDLNASLTLNGAGLAMCQVTTGARSAITYANWNIQFIADRGW